jgi:hypothetical protein
MMYVIHSILTNKFRLILVLLQDYKGTNVVFIAATPSQLQIITISVENV